MSILIWKKLKVLNIHNLYSVHELIRNCFTHSAFRYTVRCFIHLAHALINAFLLAPLTIKSLETLYPPSQLVHNSLRLHYMLIMTDTDTELVASRPDEDNGHEQVGSNESSPPPGIATPQPDLADKRLPSILHSYFGQVGSPSTTITNILDHVALDSAVDVGFASHRPEHHRAPEGLNASLPTAPHSPSEHLSEASQSPMLLPHERLGKPPTEELLGHDRCLAYPTPPMSSPSSIHERSQLEAGGNGEEGGGDGLVAYGHATRLRVLSAGTAPPRPRRQTFALNPLSSITTNSSVFAAHISNPNSRYPSTTPATPTSGAFATSALSSLSSHLENIKLTEGVAVLPRMKSTPPHTPRALSNDGADSDKSSQTQTLKPSLSNLSKTTNHDTVMSEATPKGGTAASAAAQSAPVGPPKGKLSVKISEARGLRPSYNPYVVCVFEWNEYISKEPQVEEVAMDRDDRSNNQDGIGGVTIKRSGSDTGRPVAIPMKSRQSSTNGTQDSKDLKGGRQVTDPKWDHDAILSVCIGL